MMPDKRRNGGKVKEVKQVKEAKTSYAALFS